MASPTTVSETSSPLDDLRSRICWVLDEEDDGCAGVDGRLPHLFHSIALIARGDDLWSVRDPGGLGEQPVPYSGRETSLMATTVSARSWSRRSRSSRRSARLALTATTRWRARSTTSVHGSTRRPRQPGSMRPRSAARVRRLPDRVHTLRRTAGPAQRRPGPRSGMATGAGGASHARHWPGIRRRGEPCGILARRADAPAPPSIRSCCCSTSSASTRSPTAPTSTLSPKFALVVQIDGLGLQETKLETWDAITAGAPAGMHFGWKTSTTRIHRCAPPPPPCRSNWRRSTSRTSNRRHLTTHLKGASSVQPSAAGRDLELVHEIHTASSPPWGRQGQHLRGDPRSRRSRLHVV